MVFLLLRDALPDDYLDSWYRDHSQLVEALRARDVERATATIEEHIGSAYKRLLVMTAKNASLPPDPMA